MYRPLAIVSRAEFPRYLHPQSNDARRKVSSGGDDSTNHPRLLFTWTNRVNTRSISLFRLSRYQQFKDFQKRILVATNLFGRGMDIERVNIVFNYDMPEDSDTYLHRVARAGRFGTKGLAITMVSDESDAKILNDVQERFEVNITELPDELDISSYIEGR